MIKIFLLIISISLHSLPSYGSVDGKGIVCKCDVCKLDHLDPSSYMHDNKPTEIGFHFKNNKVAIYYISKIGDDIKVSENILTTLRKKKKFYADFNEIKWSYRDSLNIYAYSLDRKTLILSKMDITKTIIHNTRKCKAYSEIKFFEKMNKLSEDYQSNFKNTTKKNKI